MQPLLTLDGIEKSFPGVRALAGAKLALYPGEVHALMGENGAGKSTLIKVMAGAHRPDAGTVTFDGRPVRINTPQEAQALGIAVIYQEFNLIPYLTARENLFLGREHTRLGFFDRRAEDRQATALLARLGVHVRTDVPCRDLTVAQQQAVEVARALAVEARVLIMDEPTAALTQQEVGRLFGVIAELKAQGLAILYVSHRMDEVFRIADRITVMRDGAWIDTQPACAFTRESLIARMVGRTLDQEFPKQAAPLGEPRLEVRGLQRLPAVCDVSFSVRRGEVLGVTGLVGAGRTEMVRLLFGADRCMAGEIRIDGQAVRLRTPRDAIRHGLCLLTEDRKTQGLVLGRSVRENYALPNLSRLSWHGLIDRKAEQQGFADAVRDLRIRVAGPNQLAGTLSGGNQQKVVLAKWLASQAHIFVFDEPTRGIDVGAKVEIYHLINRLAAEGKAILMVSSELPEVLGMSDRILVMRQGTLAGEITDVAHTTQEQVLALAM